MEQHVILIGGMYGSGKSTIAAKLANLMHTKRSLEIDFDTLIDAKGSFIYETKDRWKSFVPQIIEGLEKGNEYVFANASFYMRASRDACVQSLRKYAAVYGLFTMIPMHIIVTRLKQRHTHKGRITSLNYVENMRRFNQSFISQDNTDLLLPTDRDVLAFEYRAQMAKSPINRAMLEGIDAKDQSDERWVVVTESFDPTSYAKCLSTSRLTPYAIRQFVETHSLIGSGGRSNIENSEM